MNTNKHQMIPNFHADVGKGTIRFHDGMSMRNNDSTCNVVAEVLWVLRDARWYAEVKMPSGKGPLQVYATAAGDLPTIHERYSALGMAMCVNEARHNTGRNAVGAYSSVLDVNTSHIKEADSENMQESRIVVAHDKPGEGWFVYCGYSLKEVDDIINDILAEGILSEAVCDIIRHGCLMGCKWVELDCDGHKWDGILGAYDW